jgi:nucleoside-diphosphate-sugar epimerase
MRIVKILITGSQGYVGSSVIPKLKESFPYSELFGIDLGFFQSKISNLDVAPEILLSKLIFKDIRHISIEDLHGVDVVIHLAAISNDPMGSKFISQTYDINFQATCTLADIAKKSGVKKFIFASSASVYGESSDVCYENTKLNPLTPYADSKMKSEIYLKEVANKDFQVTILRFATACGWSPRVRSDLVLNQFVLGCLITNKIVLKSDGNSKRPLISVEDMAQAICWSVSIDRDKLLDYEVFNVGQNNWNFKIIELAELVRKNFGSNDVQIEKTEANDKRTYELNFDRYAKYCGEFNLREDILETIEKLKFNYQKLLDLTGEAIMINGFRLTSIENLLDQDVISTNFEIKKKS